MMKIYEFASIQITGFLWLILLSALCPTEAWSFSNTPMHHDLRIELEPSSKFAKIKDTVQLKLFQANCDSFALYLHADLKLGQHQVPTGWQLIASHHQIKATRLVKFEIIKSNSIPCPETLPIELEYSGVLFDPDNGDTTGFIFSGASYYYPQVIEHSSRVTFTMQVSIPEPWQVVSQGQRTKISAGKRIISWKSLRPAEEIYLIGNRFHIYGSEHKGLPLYAYLLQKDDELAQRYLETAKGYIDFYSRLIGPYPYEKFALVENSRQTGYGMPSFTLMGSRIIRFPFILHTSYPHEILHNWWGNGVFPKMKQGNWSEGLTAYLADHLLLELKGKGASYRFQEMMKFSNYVNEENDFSLSEFAYRDSMASQAIGYAKLLMVFHMLRTQVGDDNFLKGLKKFYATYKYRYAGYEDIRRTFEEVSGQNLSKFFEQWVQRKGAPEISLKGASYVVNKARYDLMITVAQVSPAFRLRLPVAIWTNGSAVGEIHYIDLDAELQEFKFQLAEEPVAVRLDPYNDVFRLPGHEEAPASLAKTYGAQNTTALMPEGETLGYQKFAQAVTERILTSKGDTPLPEGSLWVFGRNSPLKELFSAQLKKFEVELDEMGIRFKDKFYPWKNHSFIFTLNRTDQNKETMTWIIAGNKESIPGLMRKLPHYGKYGYLVFEGLAPDNREKGIWPTDPAGLQKIFSNGHPRLLPEQKPLVSFKPFS